MDTLDKHLELLESRGYLSDNFMTGAKMGYWLDEFKSHFEQIREAAIVEGREKRFMVDLTGSFNDNLEKVKFTLRLLYDPKKDELSITSLYAHLHKVFKIYKFKASEELTPAKQVYETVSAPTRKNNSRDTYVGLIFQFARERDPANDYDPDEPGKYHPDKLSSDYKPEKNRPPHFIKKINR